MYELIMNFRGIISTILLCDLKFPPCLTLPHLLMRT